MNMNDMIIKKRDKGVLTEEEIQFFVKGYTRRSSRLSGVRPADGHLFQRHE